MNSISGGVSLYPPCYARVNGYEIDFLLAGVHGCARYVHAHVDVILLYPT